MGKEINITKEGKVFVNGKEKPIFDNGSGYKFVCLEGRNQYVHRLVGKKYVPNPDNKEQINHRDCDKSNNHYENLEWVSNQENRDHAILNKLWGKNILEKRKLTDEQAQQVREMYVKNVISAKKIGMLFNVSKSTILSIINNKSYIKKESDYVRL